MFGIASATHSDFRDRVLDLVEILRSQLDHRCADVFFETLELARTGNRNDPWLLREKPGQRDLRRRRILVRGDRLQKIDETLIRFACFRSEARKKSSKIGLLEGRVLVHLMASAREARPARFAPASHSCPRRSTSEDR